ncbi:YeiH family protein [Cobetia amphilecti]|uniref:YeiH family protein n=1 Tax=Cobetia amphilecti TaxID=1055104 RepID=A0ABT6UR78_9GAMM|nr:YeiH family protein [Cobetia amphilecti]MDI5885202.1 YeiH family protein [Cobetia amphilecti]
MDAQTLTPPATAERLRRMLPGLALCGGLTLVGLALHSIPALASTGISPLVFALLCGIVVGNLPITSRHAAALSPGLHIATKKLLRLGIILFGLSITLQQILGLGWSVVFLDVLVITAVLSSGYFIGTRWLGLDRDTALLTSAGSAICGAAAVLATESMIKARPAATAMAVATVVLFGSLAMLVYPLLYPLSGMHEGLFGIYIGSTIHEVAQVVAAGEAVGPDALANALIVKLMRVMMLVPFLLLLPKLWAMRARTEGDDRETGGSMTIPWFALGFIAMAGINSTGAIPATVHSSLSTLGSVALTMAMAGLGVETRIDRLRSLGMKPFLLALILFTLLIVGGFGANLLLMG